MGFAISWVAFQSIDKNQVLPRLGLEDTREPEQPGDSPFSGAALPNDWYLVYCEHFLFVTPERLARLSSGCAVVACQVEEHAMYSASFGYKHGRQVWSLEHDAARGERDLQVFGEPPGIFADIRDDLLKNQDDADAANKRVDYIFDIPVQLATAVCAYRHDRSRLDWGEPKFFRLEGV
jgi:hypothetical protein